MITFFIDNEENSKELQTQISDFLEEWHNLSDYINTISSGSTGKPKEIKLKKEDCIKSAQKTIQYLKLKEGETAALCLPLATIGGKMMIIRSIVKDLKLIVLPVNSNPLKNIDEKIDFIALVPLQLEQILKENPDKLKSIKNIIIGGGSVSNRLQNTLKEKGLTVYQTFGMTETISHVAIRRIGLNDCNSFEALPGISFSDIKGQLIIHYPEIGHEALITNDEIELIDNRHFNWLGRTDFTINSGGIKIQPETIESRIQFLDLPNYIISGIQDERLGEKVILIIESINEIPNLEEQLRNILPKFEVPKEIFYLPEFVYTQSGKINRPETRKLILKNVAP